MRPLLSAIAIGTITATTALPAQAAEKLFITVTTAEPQVQGMAMVLGMEARKRGTDVRILLCGPGGDLALKGAEMPPLKPAGKTPRQMLQGLLAQGATAEVCALYLPNSGKTADTLIDGVSPVTPPVIGDYMIQPDVRYLAF